MWYLYRITGDAHWRAVGWDMFLAVNAATTTNYGNSAISDVTSPSSGLQDKMESFWLAETLKYFWLLYDDESNVSLDDYVLNTEAHPFLRPDAAQVACSSADGLAAGTPFLSCYSQRILMARLCALFCGGGSTRRAGQDFTAALARRGWTGFSSFSPPLHLQHARRARPCFALSPAFLGLDSPSAAGEGLRRRKARLAWRLGAAVLALGRASNSGVPPRHGKGNTDADGGAMAHDCGHAS